MHPLPSVVIASIQIQRYVLIEHSVIRSYPSLHVHKYSVHTQNTRRDDRRPTTDETTSARPYAGQGATTLRCHPHVTGYNRSEMSPCIILVGESSLPRQIRSAQAPSAERPNPNHTRPHSTARHRYYNMYGVRSTYRTSRCTSSHGRTGRRRRWSLELLIRLSVSLSVCQSVRPSFTVCSPLLVRNFAASHLSSLLTPYSSTNLAGGSVPSGLLPLLLVSSRPNLVCCANRSPRYAASSLRRAPNHTNRR